jgi:hypothetical protein
MNWRRGLFRLWIVGAALFVIAVASISYSEIKKQFEETSLQDFSPSRTLGGSLPLTSFVT